MFTVFWNDREQRLRSFWRIAIHLICTAIAIIANLFAIIVPLDLIGVERSDIFDTFLFSFIQSSVLFYMVLLAAVVLDRRRLSDFSLGSAWPSQLACGLLLGAVAMLAIFAVELMLGWVTILRFGANDGLSTKTLLYSQSLWLILMISVGVGEEYVSRGYHLKNIAEGLSFAGRVPAVCWAILLSSMFFGVLHIANDNSSWISTISIMLAGIMLAVSRIVTGNMAMPIGIHITWNYFQGPLLGFPVSGHAAESSLIEIAQGGSELWTGGAFGPEAGLFGVFAELLILALFVCVGIRSGKVNLRFRQQVRYRARRKRLISIAG